METQSNKLLQIARDLYPDYDQIAPLGHGGMGDIYRGRKVGLNVPVVIKIIKSKFKERLDQRKEAEVLKGLKHKYLPRIYDVIENQSGYLYTIMDFIPGEDLKVYVRRTGVVDQKTVYRWSQQLCDVVSYLHEQTPPIIHSDIKPSNLMITPDGNICLIDFNTSLELRSGLTAIGKTRGYAAPEQYTKPEQVVQEMQQAAGLAPVDTNQTIVNPSLTERDDDTVITQKAFTGTGSGSATKAPSTGSSEPLFSRIFRSSAVSTASTGSTRTNYYGTVSKQTDVYAIGATIYFALTGIDPPHALEPAVPLSTFKLSVSRSLVQIVERAMQKNAQDRFRDAAEMGRALQNIHQLDRKFRSVRMLTIVGILVEAVLLLGGVALIFAGTNRIRVEQNTAYYELLFDAQAQKNAGNFDEAAELTQQAQTLLDTRMEAYAEEAAVYYARGAASATIEERQVWFKKCVTTVQALLSAQLTGGTDQEWAKAFFVGAESCMALEESKTDKQDYSQARSWYRSAIAYLPEENYYRGYIYACALDRDLENAQLALEEAQSVFPASDFESSALLIQAELCYYSGDYAGAVENYRKVLAVENSESVLRNTFLTVNKVCVDGGDALAAVRVELLEEACDRLPSSWFLFKPLLANAYHKQAELHPEERELWLQKTLDAYDAVSFTTLSFDIQLEYARILRIMNRLEEAEQVLLGITERHPDDYRAYMQLSWVYHDIADVEVSKPNVTQKEKEAYVAWTEKAREVYLMAKECYDQSGAKDSEMEQLINYWAAFDTIVKPKEGE